MRRGSTMSLSFPPFTPAVKKLLIANFAVFLLFALLGAFDATAAYAGWGYTVLGLRGITVVHGWVWQLVTYSFLHAGLLHVLFNMLALWMFGAQLEIDWGASIFYQFYFFSVVGAALCTVAISFTGLLGVSPATLTVGASGGIYGLLVAFGILHGDSEVMLFPIPFLIKARYFVIGIIFLALYGALASSHGGGQSIAYMAHLGGALFGYLYLRFVPRRGFAFVASARVYGIRNAYYRWKRRRAARKFEVYMRKHDRPDYKREDYFDEYGNYRDPDGKDRPGGKRNGDARPPWVN